MIVVILYSILGDCPVFGIAWRETASTLLLRVRYSNGLTQTRALNSCTFGHLLADAGIYSPRLAIRVPTLSEGLDLIGKPVTAVKTYSEADVHFSRCCKLRQCSQADMAGTSGT